MAITRTRRSPASNRGAAASIATTVSGITAGNTIIVLCWGWQSVVTNPSCADSASNTYTRDALSADVAANGEWCVIFRSSNIATVPTSVTVTIGGGVAEIVILEVSGLVNTGQPDVAVKTALGSSAAPAPGAMTTLTANDYLVAVMACNVASGAITTPSGYTSQQQEVDGNTYSQGEAIDRIVSATGAYNPTWTIASASAWAAAQAAYKGSGGAAPTLNPAAMMGHL